jgi:uncharacterized protein YneF (UPF0154 family)
MAPTYIPLVLALLVGFYIAIRYMQKLEKEAEN